MKQSNNKRKFIIDIDQNEGSFEISTPEGHIEYEVLVEVIGTILGILLEEETQEQVKKKKRKPRVKKKDLN